jgi:hypothetical protein
MWKFTMRRVLQGKSTTASAIYSPANEHICCMLERGADLRMPAGEYPVRASDNGCFYIGDQKVSQDQEDLCPAWHVLLAGEEYAIPPDGHVDNKAHADAYQVLHRCLDLALSTGGAVVSIEDA